jgi:hypothetical protein
MSMTSQQLADIEAKLDQVIKFLEALGMGRKPRRTAIEIDRIIDAKVLKLTTPKKASENP